MAMEKNDAVEKAESAVKTSSGKPFSRLADDWHHDLRKQLLRRIGIAALLIFTLLGGLALYDSLNSPTEFDDEEDPRTSRAVEPTKPIKPAPVDSTTKQVSASDPPDDATPATPTTLAPPATPVNPATASLISKKPDRSSGTPADRSSIADRPASGATPVTEPGGTGQQPVTAAAPPPPEISAKPVLPATFADDAERSGAPKVQPPPRAGYLLQSSVLTDAAHAEALQAQLAKLGIPSVIETRLQVGPFRSRADAETARRQMNALGIDGAMQRIKSGSR